MFDFQSKFKRQIEILGICLSGKPFPKPVRTFDLSYFFRVEELTIKRDLQDLRSYGIDIHSHKKNGICIASDLPSEKLVDIILHYAGLNHNDYALDKSTSLLVEQKGPGALGIFITLQLCIDNSESAEIDYNKMGSKVEYRKMIEPLLIFQSEGSWRLLAGSGGKMKQYIIDKIVDVTSAGRSFEKSGYRFPDLFKHSWKSWLGDEMFKVKLWLSPYWAERVRPRMLINDQKIIRSDDGSIIFECTVNSLNEIAGWIVGRGEGVKVLDPPELKSLVINLANGVLNNY
jgi:predicted DNA-binding transcriptional regulator YafY